MTSATRPTIREALARFADELSAHRYLERLLWPHGVACPFCGNQERVGKLNGASTRLGAYKCYACRKSFTITHGTLLSSSHVPVHKWLQALYLTEGGAKQIRPHHLQQILNVSFKTASAMLRRISDAAAAAEQAESCELSESSERTPSEEPPPARPSMLTPAAVHADPGEEALPRST
jgi:transposase-like protein